MCFFWAPFRWFFSGRRNDNERFAPWVTLTYTAIGSALIVYLLSVALDDPWAIPYTIAKAVQILSSAIGLLCIFCGGGDKVHDLIVMHDAYRNAKASKICPLIEVEDEDDLG